MGLRWHPVPSAPFRGCRALYEMAHTGCRAFQGEHLQGTQRHTGAHAKGLAEKAVSVPGRDGAGNLPAFQSSSIFHLAAHRGFVLLCFVLQSVR